MDTIAQDEKDAIREEMIRDELHERNMRNDIDYFFKHSGLDEFREAYHELHKKMWDYGWLDNPKEYL